MIKTNFYILIVLLLWMAIVPAPGSGKVKERAYAARLWYNHPAVNWNEALPVGNGRLGAMVFGGVALERLQLNEATLWSGAPRNWNNPQAKKYLPLVRQAVAQKKYHVADSLTKFMQGPYTESYLPMADVWIRHQNITDSGQYLRKLSLDSALHTVRFVSNGDTCTRTVFASFPDQAIVYHDTCTRPGSVSFNIGLSSKLHYRVISRSPNQLELTGGAPRHVEPAYIWQVKDSMAIQYAKEESGEGMRFDLRLLVTATNGKIDTANNRLSVSNADAATIIITAGTSYNGYDKSPGLQGKDPVIKATADLNTCADKSYGQLLERHLADYQPLFSTVQLNLGQTETIDLPTDERLKKMKEHNDPEMVSTIFQYSRYLLIAGSRPGGQPVNLKGIWNDKVRPEYSSNYCIDHDAQMFYYPVETTHLSGMHEPFLKLIEELAANGAQTARFNYGLPGWCAHHNTDIWRQSGPVGNYGDGNPHWATWNMSGPWLCAHLYDHYLFTGDTSFLRNRAWPVMKGAAMFCLGWLTKDSKGRLQSVPSVSPENTFITKGGDTAQVSRNSTADIALIKELFRNCLQASSVLHADEVLMERVRKAMALLPSYKMGSAGQLLEWEEEWQPVDPGHRHLSHLYPVFPGSEIDPVQSPSWALAAKKALSLRAKTNGSWGFAWKAACWSRLGEGDSAWKTLQYQLQYVDAQNTSADKYGLFPNLFNSEGKAVILNGNACATAAITEMLLQSHGGNLQLLPALPAAFQKGMISGLCARGGFTVGMSWKKHALSGATIYSTLGNTCKLITGRDARIFEGTKLVAELKKNIATQFKTEKGKTYTVYVPENIN